MPSFLKFSSFYRGYYAAVFTLAIKEKEITYLKLVILNDFILILLFNKVLLFLLYLLSYFYYILLYN